MGNPPEDDERPTLSIMRVSGENLQAFLRELHSQPIPRPMELITGEQQAQLLANGAATKRARGADLGHAPVVKLFTPDAQATWLFSECDPGEPDQLFGLCDLGFGFPELGYASRDDIAKLHGPLGFPVERDLFFRPDPKIPLSAYADEARCTGWVVTRLGGTTDAND